MKRQGGTVGLGFAKPLSVRISESVLLALETERKAITQKVGATVSASDVTRRALESYLRDAGHKIEITPWPETPNLEDQVRQLQAEVLRLKKLVPGETNVPFFE